MNQHEQLALLQDQHADLARATQAALAELSASVFNRPQLHDAFRSSGAFQRWQACHARQDALEGVIARLRAELAVALAA